MRALAIAVVAGAVLGRPALAQGPSLPPPPFAEHYTLEWMAPPECPSAAAIEARIAALRIDDGRGEGTIAVRGRVDLVEGGYRLALETEFRGHVETRALTEPQCAALGEATALVTVVALQPAGSGTRPRPEIVAPEIVPEPDPPTVEPLAPAPMPEEIPEALDVPIDPQPNRSPAPRRRAPPTAIARVAGLLESGDLPGITGGPALALGIAGRRWRVELHGAYLAPRRSLQSGIGARYQAGLVGVRGCYRVRAAALELPLCAGVEVGGLRATTIGVTPRRRADAPQFGPLASAGVARRWGRIGLWTAVEVVGRALGYAFTFGDVERFRQAPVSARLVVGLEIFVP